jgi:serine/threonine protein kinase
MLRPPENQDLVLSASGKQVRKGHVSTDRAPEIRAEEIIIEEKIGGGCFGSVFKGKCRGVTVAIKQLHKQDLDPKILEDFRKEVDIMTQMRHPNVVLFMGACTEPSKLMIVCELLKENVNDLIQKNKDMTLDKRLLIAKGAAAGMAWLHGANPQIIHRDLKPANLLVDEHWNVKVCDFGLSQVKLPEVKIKDGKSVPGTPLWMAPEVLMGKQVDSKADIYSFGLVMWEIITGNPLFPHHDNYSTFKKAIVLDNERPPIPDSIHPALRKLMEDCWDKDPSVRPNFTDILTRLDSVLIDCLIPADADANAFWKNNFLGKIHATWKDFVDKFSKLLNVNAADDPVSFEALQKLIGEPNREPNPTDPVVVSVQKFAHFVDWFGPLTLKSAENFTIFARMKLIMNQAWFHGDITKEDAERLLATEKSGTFLLRLSVSEPTAPYTISKKTKKGQINHQRIKKDPKTGAISVKIVYGDKKESVTVSSAGIHSKDNLMTFIEKQLSKELYLKYPCPGSKYRALFIPTFQTNLVGYLEDE